MSRTSTGPAPDRWSTSRNPQVTSAAPRSVFGFRIKILLASIQTDLLRQGHRSWSSSPTTPVAPGQPASRESRLTGRDQYSPSRGAGMSEPAVTVVCLRLTCDSRRRSRVHFRVRCTRLGSRARQAGISTAAAPRPYPTGERPGLRRLPVARSQPGSTHNTPFCTLRLTAAERAVAVHIGGSARVISGRRCHLQ